MAVGAGLLEPVLKTHVGQLADDDELSVDDFEAFQREQERVRALP